LLLQYLGLTGDESLLGGKTNVAKSATPLSLNAHYLPCSANCKLAFAPLKCLNMDRRPTNGNMPYLESDSCSSSSTVAAYLPIISTLHMVSIPHPYSTRSIPLPLPQNCTSVQYGILARVFLFGTLPRKGLQDIAWIYSASVNKTF
jgi:hypothetical protein